MSSYASHILALVVESLKVVNFAVFAGSPSLIYIMWKKQNGLLVELYIIYIMYFRELWNEAMNHTFCNLQIINKSINSSQNEIFTALHVASEYKYEIQIEKTQTRGASGVDLPNGLIN